MAHNNISGKSLTPRGLIFIVVLILVVVLIRQYLGPGTEIAEKGFSGAMTVEKAAADRISGIMIEVEGEASRLLSDDNEGSRHQRFILKMSSGHTVLISHNIDLAERVPVRTGDRVKIFGQYEWNDRGGVIHWTHHDPAGRHEEGWIEHRGQRYE